MITTTVKRLTGSNVLALRAVFPQDNPNGPVVAKTTATFPVDPATALDMVQAAMDDQRARFGASGGGEYRSLIAVRNKLKDAVIAVNGNMTPDPRYVVVKDAAPAVPATGEAVPASEAAASEAAAAPAATAATASPELVDHVERELVRYMITRQIFCPINGSVLDVRTAVALYRPDPDAPNGRDLQAVISPAAWDSAGGRIQAHTPDLIVVDPRPLTDWLVSGHEVREADGWESVHQHPTRTVRATSPDTAARAYVEHFRGDRDPATVSFPSPSVSPVNPLLPNQYPPLGS